MMHTGSYDILFSESQPEIFLKNLLAVLQAETNLSAVKASPSLLKILVIDINEVRADSIAQLMHAAGYKSATFTTALAAFTLFLKGGYIPRAIVLDQEHLPDPLFLQRLIQRTMQLYGFKVPLLRLAPDPISSPPLRQPSQLLNGSFRQPSQPLQELVSAELQQRTGGIEQIEREKIVLTGQSTGRYQIDTLLGGGLQGSVYQAYDRLREQEVALKAMQVSTMPYSVVRTANEDVNLFQQEFELLGMLDHPHILVPLNTSRSYISGSSFVFKTMPYYSERSLGLWLSRRAHKTFTSQEIVPLIVQLANALQCAHDHHILFQNFKLSNILIRGQTDDIRKLHVILTDFPVTQDGSFFSKTSDAFSYMAPERWQGQALPASDQYALACMAYELLAGRPPFQGQSEFTMRFLHLNMRPQAPVTFSSSLPPAINHVLLQGMAKRPEDRFPTVMAFANALQRYCS
jgi:hypothetical protein